MIVYVDARNGNDRSAGSEAEPIRSLGRAQELLDTVAKGVALRAGQRHLGKIRLNGADRTLLSYGKGSKPIIDSREPGSPLTLSAATSPTVKGVALEADTSSSLITILTSLNGARISDIHFTRGLNAVYGTGIAGGGNVLANCVIDQAYKHGVAIGGSALFNINIRDVKGQRIGTGNADTDAGSLIAASGSAQYSVERCQAYDCRMGLGGQTNTAGTNTFNRCFVLSKGATFGFSQTSTTGAGGRSDLTNCTILDREETLASVNLSVDKLGEVRASHCMFVNRSTNGLSAAIAVGSTGGDDGILSFNQNLVVTLTSVFIANLGTYTGDHNCWKGVFHDNRFQGTDTLATWQSSTSQDANSFVQDPRVVNLLGLTPEVASLLEDSPLIGAGVAGQPDDYFGRARDAGNPTIGPAIFVPSGHIQALQMSRVIDALGLAEEMFA